MKRLAPLVIVVLIGGYLLSVFLVISFVFSVVEGILLKLVFGIVAIAVLSLALALLYTLIQRFKEIQKEEEDDDISKY